MRHPTRLFAALAALSFSAPALADVVWRGDFETGDRSQWSKADIMSPNRVQVVDSPVREGRHALRVEVRQGDDPINASGNRNELVKFDGAREGTEFYYGWSTLWPEDYPMTPNWQVFMQWHHTGGGAPPVRLVLGCSANDCGVAMPDTLFFIVDGKTVWTYGPVTRGEWHDFVLHIKWSARPNVGFVELWYDGKLVLPKRMTRTMFSSSDSNYMKMGLYRDEAVRPTAVLYHDGLVQATTLEEAMRPALVSEEEGADPTSTPQEPGTSQGPIADPGTLPEEDEPVDPGAPQQEEPGLADEGSPADGIAQGPQPGPGVGLEPGLTADVTGSEQEALNPQAGCSTGAASSAPWAWLLGAFALLPVAGLRRRVGRRDQARRSL